MNNKSLLTLICILIAAWRLMPAVVQAPPGLEQTAAEELKIAANQLTAEPDVSLPPLPEVAGPIRPFHLNDPYIPNQWALPAIGATRVFTSDITLVRPITIAVLDTGCLKQADFVEIYCFGVAGFDPQDEEKYAHGTGMISLLASQGGNREGITSVFGPYQPYFRIVSIRVLAKNGYGSDETIAEGVHLARRLHVDVISMSLGTPHQDDPLTRAEIEKARSEGVVTVAASGNEYLTDAGGVSHPCADVDLCVGALKPNRTVAPFSMGGNNILAPGVAIVQASRTEFLSADGTSSATPLVAGTAAMLKAQHPSWTPDQIRTRILETADPVQGDKSRTGAGALNMYRALTEPLQ